MGECVSGGCSRTLPADGSDRGACGSPELYIDMIPPNQRRHSRTVTTVRTAGGSTVSAGLKLEGLKGLQVKDWLRIGPRGYANRPSMVTPEFGVVISVRAMPTRRETDLPRRTSCGPARTNERSMHATQPELSRMQQPCVDTGSADRPSKRARRRDTRR